MSQTHAAQEFEQAARWFAARRRGVMSVDERERYEALLRDPANASLMATLERAWSSLEIAKDRFPLEQPMPARPHWSKLARGALVAGMCVLTLGIGVLSYSDDSGFWTRLNWTDR